MRYLVTARVKTGKSDALLDAIDEETLGRGSVAGDEYLRNMGDARQHDDGRVQWVEVCYCATPLAEERDYWTEYFSVHATSRLERWIVESIENNSTGRPVVAQMIGNDIL